MTCIVKCYFPIPPTSLGFTISVLNYYFLKNSVQTTIRLTWRLSNGAVAKVENLEWNSSNITNASTPAEISDTGTLLNLKLLASKTYESYSASICIYETDNSVAFVHSYSRAYNDNEPEANLDHILHQEGCWTLKDTSQITSSAVFHNGPRNSQAQIAKLTVTNHHGQSLSASIPIPQLNPFATYILTPKYYFDDLEGFLGSQLGSAQVQFTSSGAFGRMLLVWRNQSQDLLTVTLSNFYYSECNTETLNTSDDRCYAKVPPIRSTDPHLSYTEITH